MLGKTAMEHSEIHINCSVGTSDMTQVPSVQTLGPPAFDKCNVTTDAVTMEVLDAQKLTQLCNPTAGSRFQG